MTGPSRAKNGKHDLPAEGSQGDHQDPELSSSQSSTPWYLEPAPAPDLQAARAASEQQQQLTKPPGALGRLEELAAKLASLQGRPDPAVEQVRIAVFAADHGVAHKPGVSKFGQEVTARMLDNFAAGGAAINVLARALGAELQVVNLGVAGPARQRQGVRDRSLGQSSADLSRQPALSAVQLQAALAAGREALADPLPQLFIGGEMGIGNSTAAAALSAALLPAPPQQVTGPGTGLDSAGLAHKVEVVRTALKRYRDLAYTTAEDITEQGAATQQADPLEALRQLGGFEIAALSGAYVAAAQRQVAVLLDGFISTCAALVAVLLNPSIQPWLLCSHRSAEPGHQALLQKLELAPLLELGLRLGEGSGAALAVPLLRMACALHNQMARLDQFEIHPVDDHPAPSAS